MVKTLAFLTVGIVVGVLLMMILWQPSPTTFADAGEPLAADGDVAVSRGDLAELAGRFASVEARIDELATAVAALQAAPPATQTGASMPQAANAAWPQAVPLPSALPPGTVAFAAAATPGAALPIPPGALPGALNSFDADVQRLVDSGFTRERAEALRRRADELALEQMQSRYEAERDGQQLPPDLLAGYGPEQALRAELGDAEYEQYLKALGRPTEVSVFGVLADSPAAKAGIQTGDKIVAYGGTRVFDMREINPLTLQGTPGESVVVEIEREGRRSQVLVPRGPLGISGGGITISNGATRIQVLRP